MTLQIDLVYNNENRIYNFLRIDYKFDFWIRNLSNKLLTDCNILDKAHKLSCYNWKMSVRLMVLLRYKVETVLCLSKEYLDKAVFNLQILFYGFNTKFVMFRFSKSIRVYESNYSDYIFRLRSHMYSISLY